MQQPFEPGVVVDPQNAIAREDAFWGEMTQDGCFAMHETITDTTSCDPKLARMVLESVTRNKSPKPYKMMSSELVSEKFSFLKGEERDAFTVSTRFTANLERSGEPEVHLSRIRPEWVLEYEDVLDIIKTPEHALNKQLKTATYITDGLMAKRVGRGSTGLIRIPFVGVTNEEGMLRRISNVRAAAYSIVGISAAEAGVGGGQILHQNNIPAGYSHQDGYADVSSINLVQQLELDKSAPDPREISRMRTHLGTDTRAVRYGIEPAVYHSLDAHVHTKLTAPLRRTIAFVNSHNLVSFLKGEDYPFSLEDVVELCESLNALAERRRKHEISGVWWKESDGYWFNPAALLGEWAVRVGLLQPQYTFRELDSDGDKSLYSCTCSFHGYNHQKIAVGIKEAQHAVAKAMCKSIFARNKSVQ